MNRQQQRAIEYLLEENQILREQLDTYSKGKRIKFNPSQKRRLAEKGRKLGRKALEKIANLVNTRDDLCLASQICCNEVCFKR